MDAFKGEQDISTLKLPEQLSRRVRSSSDFNNSWKGDEFQVFLLYDRLPLLESRLTRALYLSVGHDLLRSTSYC